MDNFKVGNAERAAMYAAGGAFLLSLAIGIASGNPFGISFARGFLLSILFGGILYASIHILMKFVPEMENLSSELAKGRGRSGAKDSGETLAPRGERGHVVDLNVSEDLSESLRIQPASRAREGVPSAGAQAAEGPPTDIEKAAGGLPEGELAAGEPAAGAPYAGKPGVKPAGTELEDILPSLDSLFEGGRGESRAVDERERATAERKKTKNGYINVGKTRMRFEPEIMAKAVKRMMKKDESG